jgi:hypothetical protein
MGFWDSTFLSTATKRSQGSTDGDGDPGGYGASSTFACRVQRSKDRDAEEIEHDAVLYTSTLILPTDRIWLPGDSTNDANLARRPVQVYTTTDLDDSSSTLYKVLLGGA